MKDPRKRSTYKTEPGPLCACGCGQHTVKSWGRVHKYVRGHVNRKHGFGAEAKANERMFRVYGINRKAYDAMVQAQGNACALCRATDPGPGRNGTRALWCIDHDHTTGKVRGLLCRACNTGIGLLRDDPDLLRAAAAYVERNRDDEA